MATGDHSRNAEEITRREHNEPAMSKRSLLVAFNQQEEIYAVPDIDSEGNLAVKDKANQTTEERLQTIEDIVKLLLLHAQVITGEEFTSDDFNIERG